jgi:hypothetical protein
MRTIGIGAVIVVIATAATAQTPIFQSASRYSLPGSVTDTFYLSTLITADIGSADGPPDGIPDVITANTNQQAPVEFGDGQGHFVTGPNVQLKTIPSAIALADFDSDNTPDLLVGDSRTVRFLKGNGDGSFQNPAAAMQAGLGVAAILAMDVNGDAIDLNGDHKMDAIVVNDHDQLPGANGDILVLFGNGDGTFTTGTTFPTGLGSESAALGDFNNDGKIDVAVANAGSGDVNILLGDGTGNFTYGQVPQVGTGTPEPVAIATADLNNDHFLDLIVLNRNTDSIAVLNGQGGGNFAAAKAFPSGSVGSVPISLTLKDMNADQKMDVIVANSRSNDASVLLGDGHGNFGPPRAFVSDVEPQAVAALDVNSDTIPDVVTVNRGSATQSLAVLPGMGDGSLAGVEDIITQPSPTGVATGDVDNDGLPDLVVCELPPQQSSNGVVLVIRADRVAGFAPPTVLRTTGDAVAVTVGDFNQDERLDIAALNKSTNNISVFLGTASGFSALHDYPVGTGASAITAVDLNGDGRADLAVARQGSGSTGAVDVLLANADGSFGTAKSSPVGMGPVALDFGDFNNDGKRDLVVADASSNEVSVLLGKGDGTFQAATSIVSAGGPRAIAVADFDHDGSDDFSVAVSMNSNVTVFYGNGQGGFTAGSPLGVSGTASAIAARDLTGDLIPDILVTDQVSNVVSAFYSTGSTRQFRHDSRVDDISVSRGPMAASVADVDGDGRYDGIAVNALVAGSVSVLTNIGAMPPVLRGDGNNGDQRISAADVVAVIRELGGDGNGRRVEDVQVAGGAYMASAGVDANGDGFVTPQDVLAVAHELFPGL